VILQAKFLRAANAGAATVPSALPFPIFACVFARVFARCLCACGLLLTASLCSGLSSQTLEQVSAEVSSASQRPPPGSPPTQLLRHGVWELVIAQLRAQGIAEPQLPRISDLDLPGALPSLAGRQLHVASQCWDEGPKRAQFRMECGEAGQCLPFLVYLHDSGRAPNNAPEEAQGFVNARGVAGLCRPLSELRHSASASRSASVLPSKPTITVGQHATAVFLTQNLRMSASVICLERGSEGDVIRARSQNGEVFRARISGPAMLQALPE